MNVEEDTIRLFTELEEVWKLTKNIEDPKERGKVRREILELMLYMEENVDKLSKELNKYYESKR